MPEKADADADADVRRNSEDNPSTPLNGRDNPCAEDEVNSFDTSDVLHSLLE